MLSWAYADANLPLRRIFSASNLSLAWTACAYFSVLAAKVLLASSILSLMVTHQFAVNPADPAVSWLAKLLASQRKCSLALSQVFSSIGRRRHFLQADPRRPDFDAMLYRSLILSASDFGLPACSKSHAPLLIWAMMASNGPVVQGNAILSSASFCSISSKVPYVVRRCSGMA